MGFRGITLIKTKNERIFLSCFNDRARTGSSLAYATLGLLV